MKLKSSFWRVMLMSMTAAACMCISACSSDDPTPDPTPKPNPGDNGEVTFTIDLPQGSGNGSSSSPAVVNKGEKLNMAISQKSSYTDPDGTVFTCEPKATIELFAKLDTVVAKDLKELTKVKEGSDIKTDKTGTSPVVSQTVQTFDVGGQNIVFDLSHEIYTYITSTKDKIEMPYIKLNEAKFGSTGTTEKTPQGRSAAVVTGVTVRPLAMSRAAVLRDSAMYEVNVRFSLDIESVNAKQNTKQTLEFSVNYVGIVETITELADPVAEVSYKWDVKSGTTSSATPFVKTKGKTPMEIWMAQSCSYTDEYGNQATGEPKAKIKLSVAQDTVWTKTLDELKKFAAKTGGTSSEQAATQKFGSDLQDVEIEWSYEVGEAVLADKTIPMPFYTLAPVKLKDVSVKEVPDKKTVAGKPVDVYEVTATFSQKAVAKNVTTETPEVEVEYVVSYIGVVGATVGEPSAEISYKWDIKSGTKSTVSPFVKTKGRTPMEIWMAQSCSYADGHGSQVTGEPKAKIKLSVAQDTVWAKTQDELKKFAAKEGGSSSEQAATQKFGSELQNVDIEWSYEVGSAVLGEEKISLPFYTLTPVKLKDVSVKEVSDGVTIAGKEASVYEVTATFSQKAVAKNVENVSTETPEVEIEYVVSYIGAVELTLVKVEYIPSGKWVDPHDNMALAYYAKVERYRTYSNGKRVGPDEFYDYGHPVYLSTTEALPGTYQFGDEVITYFSPNIRTVGDSIKVYSRSIQFSSTKGEFCLEFMRDEYSSDQKFTDYNWEAYKLSAPENDSRNLAKDFNNPEYPRDDRQSGWYYYPFIYVKEYDILWPINDEEKIPVAGLNGIFEFYDQFLVIDGRRIDFKSLHKLDINYSLNEEKLSTADKEGKIEKLEMRASYLGKKFLLTRIDSLYVAK